MPKGLSSWVSPDSVKLTININHNQSIFVEVSPWEPTQMASCFGASLFTAGESSERSGLGLCQNQSSKGNGEKNQLKQLMKPKKA